MSTNKGLRFVHVNMCDAGTSVRLVKLQEQDFDVIKGEGGDSDEEHWIETRKHLL